MTRFALVALLVGCNGPVPVASPGGSLGRETRWVYQEPATAIIDVVVVMDDSASMAPKQTEVLRRLEHAFGPVLATLPGFNDIEVRVISSTPQMPSAAACPLPLGGVFRWNRTCGGGPNFEGPLESAIACGARFPSSGSGLEQPLAALEAHLAHRPLRPHASLFVLIVTDEDDCSFLEPPSADDRADGPELSLRCRQADEAGELTPVSRYVKLLQSVSRNFVVSVVTGQCTGAGLDAQPAPRLRRFAEALGTSGMINDFCEPDWGRALAYLGLRLPILYGWPCIEPLPLDRDPVEAGLQPDCVLTDRSPSGPPRALPDCHSAGPPCWQLVPERFCSASGYSLQINRGGCAPPAGTTIELACATPP